MSEACSTLILACVIFTTFGLDISDTKPALGCWISSVTTLKSVKFRPSSGLAIGSTTRAAAAEDCRTYVAAPPTSPCFQVFPGRRGGPLGRPYRSACTLTAGRRDGGPSPTALYGDAGRELPVLGNLSGRRRWTYIWCIRDIIFFVPVCCSSPQERGPGFRSGPTYLGPGPKLHNPADTWSTGLCVTITYQILAEGHCRTR